MTQPPPRARAWSGTPRPWPGTPRTLGRSRSGGHQFPSLTRRPGLGLFTRRSPTRGEAIVAWPGDPETDDRGAAGALEPAKAGARGNRKRW